MDVRHFLESRLSFIERFYRDASAPFLERKRLIEAEEEPFVPPYSEDEEPPFLSEWLEADDSLQVLGQSCLSMLAASLHLYFRTWERQLRRPVDESLRSTFNKRGWFAGYALYYARNFGVIFDSSPCNLALLEELVLARNQVQHPDEITSHHAYYSKDDLRKVSSPFFVGDRELELLASIDQSESSWLLPPTIHVTAEKLAAALSEIRAFVAWLESTDHQGPGRLAPR